MLVMDLLLSRFFQNLLFICADGPQGPEGGDVNMAEAEAEEGEDGHLGSPFGSGEEVVAAAVEDEEDES